MTMPILNALDEDGIDDAALLLPFNICMEGRKEFVLKKPDAFRARLVLTEPEKSGNTAVWTVGLFLYMEGDDLNSEETDNAMESLEFEHCLPRKALPLGRVAVDLSSIVNNHIWENPLAPCAATAFAPSAELSIRHDVGTQTLDFTLQLDAMTDDGPFVTNVELPAKQFEAFFNLPLI